MHAMSWLARHARTGVQSETLHAMKKLSSQKLTSSEFCIADASVGEFMRSEHGPQFFNSNLSRQIALLILRTLLWGRPEAFNCRRYANCWLVQEGVGTVPDAAGKMVRTLHRQKDSC
jgi:hypothetical protein